MSLPARDGIKSREGVDEDDGKPYAVPDDEEKKEPCPNCRKLLPQGAVVCAYCGFNSQTGEILERLYKTIDKQWEGGLRLQVRITIFLAAAALASAATVIVGAVDGGWVALVISFLIGVLLLAYALGTYSRINLVRSRKGRARLTRTWHICFIPWAPADIRLRGYEGVVVGRAPEPDFWDWAILVFLLPWGLIPGVLWWLFMIHPDQFHVALCNCHGYPTLILYQGPSQAIADEIGAAIRDVAGLPLRSPA